ncbi:hypothetical protein FRC17_000909 [Serendipita sp. 399]|nr:hypothetical protein FRC17_000909 [Serendipita sp. 399]
MDFFNSKAPSSSNNPYDGLQTPFGDAINQRFANHANSSLLTSKLTPAIPLQTPMLPSMSMQGRFAAHLAASQLPSLPQGIVAGASVVSLSLNRQRTTSSVTPSTFVGLPPDAVASLINSSSSLLLIDIRTPTQYEVSRIFGAISLAAPSTFLKRPSHTLDKLAESIGDAESREIFENWNRTRRIIAYDADTTSLTEASNIHGLLKKFQAAGYVGDLEWIRGGFHAVAKIVPSILDSSFFTHLRTSEDATASAVPLRAKDLSAHAFKQSSTTLVSQKTPRGSDHRRTTSSDTIAVNPFYDNIRQNVELSHGIDNKIPLVLPANVIARKMEFPFKWLRSLVDQAVADDIADALAMQFYRIELGEQRRLQGVMDYHSKERGTIRPGNLAQEADYPYSITAGFEMGEKNRYRNIWPFEHARVRLQKGIEKGGSDYVNASFVQSLVSTRRYIATQGPLDSTYNDFWTICWEQNVPVIVMLTREIESSLVKCGHYWKDGKYGDISLRLVSQDGEEENTKTKSLLQPGSFFHRKTSDEPSRDSIIKRIFELRHKGHPKLSPRFITHLQYLGWPDLDVPSSPAGLLSLIKQVNVAVEAGASASSQGLNPKQGPVLLHCSAGVGRTGGFILVDSILSGIRHEMLRTMSSGVGEGSSMDMEVDESESVSCPVKSLSQRDIVSSPLSSVATLSGSGTDGAHRSRSRLSTTSDWSKNATEGATVALRADVPKLRPLSHLAVENLSKASKKLSREGSSVNVVAWSKTVPMSSNVTTPFSSSPHQSDLSADASPTSNYYKRPRNIDEPQGSPPFPSTFMEPIREVLEDLREQRMSLCQSLRQYVFVHRAIIEGALEIVDEFKSSQNDTSPPPLPEKPPKTRPMPISNPVSHPNETAWSSTSSISSINEPLPSSLASSRAMAGRKRSFGENRSSRASSLASSPPPHPPTLTGKRTVPEDGTISRSHSTKRKHRMEEATAGDNARSMSSASAQFAQGVVPKGR